VSDVSAALANVGATVFERGWLSSNTVLFPDASDAAVVVDTGYVAHAAQTVALLEQALAGRPLGRVLNTHLHSDHCGGNAALQDRFGCEVHIPLSSYHAACAWDMLKLSFDATGQRCERFRPGDVLRAGAAVRLGRLDWEVHACGGHDADAVVLFEPRHRVLISGDALWEHRVAIVFEALHDAEGFEAALDSLALIEKLAPRVVIPGHGAPFGTAPAAIARSRDRISAFRSGRVNHMHSARRSLLMFHFLEHRRRTLNQLRVWARGATVFRGEIEWVEPTARELSDQGLLRLDGEFFEVTLFG
jgi:glyoxylase-like metal-dependent hydrolase (beta-lactamase superfamily II)